MVDLADNPFPGPQPYRAEDRQRFFGRDALAATMKDTVATRRVLTVYGPSGAGKSSILQAAVIPELEAERGYRVAWLDAWPKREVIQRGPVEHLREVLLGGLKVAPGAASLAAGLRSAFRRSPRPVLLVCDQLEQLLLAHTAADVAAVVDDIEAAATLEGVPLHIVLCLREDYLGRWRERLRDAPELARHALRVGRLTVPEMVDAVLNIQASAVADPALRWRREQVQPLVESMALSRSAVSDEREVEAAYVQIVFRALYAKGGAWAGSGTAQAVLADYLTDVVERLGADSDNALKLLQDLLITEDGSRAPMTQRMAVDHLRDEAAVTRILSKLADARIVRRQDHDGLEFYELGHDWLASVLREAAQARQEGERRRAEERRQEAARKAEEHKAELLRRAAEREREQEIERQEAEWRHRVRLVRRWAGIGGLVAGLAVTWLYVGLRGAWAVGAERNARLSSLALRNSAEAQLTSDNARALYVASSDVTPAASPPADPVDSSAPNADPYGLSAKLDATVRALALQQYCPMPPGHAGAREGVHAGDLDPYLRRLDAQFEGDVKPALEAAKDLATAVLTTADPPRAIVKGQPGERYVLAGERLYAYGPGRGLDSRSAWRPRGDIVPDECELLLGDAGGKLALVCADGRVFVGPLAAFPAPTGEEDRAGAFMEAFGSGGPADPYFWTGGWTGAVLRGAVPAPGGRAIVQLVGVSLSCLEVPEWNRVWTRTCEEGMDCVVEFEGEGCAGATLQKQAVRPRPGEQTAGPGRVSLPKDVPVPPEDEFVVPEDMREGVSVRKVEGRAGPEWLVSVWDPGHPPSWDEVAWTRGPGSSWGPVPGLARGSCEERWDEVETVPPNGTAGTIQLEPEHGPFDDHCRGLDEIVGSRVSRWVPLCAAEE